MRRCRPLGTEWWWRARPDQQDRARGVVEDVVAGGGSGCAGRDGCSRRHGPAQATRRRRRRRSPRSRSGRSFPRSHIGAPAGRRRPAGVCARWRRRDPRPGCRGRVAAGRGRAVPRRRRGRPGRRQGRSRAAARYRRRGARGGRWRPRRPARWLQRSRRSPSWGISLPVRAALPTMPPPRRSARPERSEHPTR